MGGIGRMEGVSVDLCFESILHAMSLEVSHRNSVSNSFSHDTDEMEFPS